MSHASDVKRGASPRKRRSLRWHLLVMINGAVVAVVALFLFWDTVSEWRIHLDEKREALTEEAATLLPGVLLQRDDPEKLQGYIDEVCGRAREEVSPGHHIAVEVDGRVLQAKAHHRQSEGLFRAMREAAASADGMAVSGEVRIIAGSASRQGATVWVSEYLDDVERLLTRQILRRVLSVLILGMAVGVVVNVLVDRLVARPVGQVVGSVRRLSAGELGVQATPPRTEELAFLVEEFNAMSASLAEVARARRWQMEKAQRIQEHLQPDPSAAAGLGVAFACEPASEVGGDYFDTALAGDGTALVCIADVTGHGVPAAMGAAVLKTLFAAAVRRTAAPDEILAEVGSGFADVSLEEDFASMLVVAVNRRDGRVRYASAGHPPGYLMRAGQAPEPLPATGPVLGPRIPEAWRTVSLEAGAGDRVVLVTDGLMDAVNAEGTRFGQERVEAALGEWRGEPVDRFCRHVMERIREFRGAAPPFDDMTIVAVQL